MPSHNVSLDSNWSISMQLLPATLKPPIWCQILINPRPKKGFGVKKLVMDNRCFTKSHSWPGNSRSKQSALRTSILFYFVLITRSRVRGLIATQIKSCCSRLWHYHRQSSNPTTQNTEDVKDPQWALSWFETRAAKEKGETQGHFLWDWHIATWEARHTSLS